MKLRHIIFFVLLTNFLTFAGTRYYDTEYTEKLEKTIDEMNTAADFDVIYTNKASKYTNNIIEISWIMKDLAVEAIKISPDEKNVYGLTDRLSVLIEESELLGSEILKLKEERRVLHSSFKYAKSYHIDFDKETEEIIEGEQINKTQD